MPKKIKPGKLKGPSHDDGGILLEAEGGEYIIKKSSVDKIGKAPLDKLNKTGELPVKKYDEGGRIEKLTKRKKRVTDKQKKLISKKVNKEKRMLADHLNLPPADEFLTGDQFQDEKDLNKFYKVENFGTNEGIRKAHKSRKFKRLKKKEQRIDKKIRASKGYESGGKVGDSIKTYSNGGYVEGE